MSEFDEFEKEVLSRSKKIRFDGCIPFVGVATPDVRLNNSFLSITFNSIMHKIISHHHLRFLSYPEYELLYNNVIQEKKTIKSTQYFYQGELVLELSFEMYKGFERAVLTPHDKEIIALDREFLKKYRAEK